ncbi:organic solvent tolerance protein OstA [Sporosarcina sp. FSL K6-5500]|uniref:organic solvent tolerance protein OstA n=1 Tax=Sporosarcina sp. FSL K6-5500 TaxID=2921558 RepID=UPI0030F69B22
MTKKQLNVKEQHYAGSREEAEEIVTEAKDDIYLTMHKISEKHNKLGTYFLVDLQFNYDTPREIMESAPDKESDHESDHGPTHEGVKVVVVDGAIQVDPNQMEIDDIENKNEGEAE